MNKEMLEKFMKPEGTTQDLITFNKRFYKGLITKHLEECKNCEHHKGMDDNFVKCNHLINFTVMVISQPCFYEEGFKNGERIVHCPKRR